MTQELARHGYAISPGTLYPTLHRMQAEGLLISHTVVVEGRQRRLYEVTPAGRVALEADRAALRELAREVLAAEAADESGKAPPQGPPPSPR
jgi:DNA-binding PadR family transcriptional regulator